MNPETVERATLMLAALLEGRQTYREAGRRFGVGSTTVERQIKVLLRHVARTRSIPGIEDPAFATLQLLRRRSGEVMQAVRAFDPKDIGARPSGIRVIDAGDLSAGAARVRRLSSNGLRDVALLYLLFATGAKPIEIARLQVNDYLADDGSVRSDSELLASAASRGRKRPLYFRSAKACEAIDAYLAQRRERHFGVGAVDAAYRGLDPQSRLFLTEDGRPFQVRSRGANDPRPCCKRLEANFHTIFTRAGWVGITTQRVRRLVAIRLAGRGADEEQVAELLGLQHLSSVRRLLERQHVSLDSLVKDLA